MDLFDLDINDNSYYIGDNTNNKWVHKNETSTRRKKRRIFQKKNKEVNLMEAA